MLIAQTKENETWSNHKLIKTNLYKNPDFDVQIW